MQVNNIIKYKIVLVVFLVIVVIWLLFVFNVIKLQTYDMSKGTLRGLVLAIDLPHSICEPHVRLEVGKSFILYQKYRENRLPSGAMCMGFEVENDEFEFGDATYCYGIKKITQATDCVF